MPKMFIISTDSHTMDGMEIFRHMCKVERFGFKDKYIVRKM